MNKWESSDWIESEEQCEEYKKTAASGLALQQELEEKKKNQVNENVNENMVDFERMKWSNR